MKQLYPGELRELGYSIAWFSLAVLAYTLLH